MQYGSHKAPERVDGACLRGMLDEKLMERQARVSGICPVREELFSQCFDEIIRQVTINEPERGLLLLRVRDEIKMTISDKALDLIADEGYDPQYGARPIKRLIQRDIVNLLSKKLLGNELRNGSSFNVDVENGELIIKPDLVNQVFLN